MALAGVAMLAIMAAALAFASPSRAGLDFGNGDFALFADDICSLTVSPTTGTLNVNGTQTFQFAIVSNPNMPQDLPYIEFPNLQPGSAEGGEKPPIDPAHVVEGCVLKDFTNLAGLNVSMKVLSGPGAPATYDALLQADGTVTFPLVNGGVTGTDQVEFEVFLPKTCLVFEDFSSGEPYGYIHYAGEIDDCEEELAWDLDGLVGDSTRAHPDARPVPDPTVRLTATAAVTWIAPPVVPAAVVSVRSFKSCVSNRIRIRPTYSPGLRSARLVIDGKTVARKSNTSAFVVNPAKYKPGKHRYRVIATYDSGSVTSNTGTFNRCKVKVSVKRVKPKFTG